MSRQKNRRRTVLIRPAFQIRFIVMVVLLVALASVLSGLAARYLLFGEVSTGMSSAHLEMAQLRERVSLALLVAHTIGGASAMLGTVIGVLYASHRIAGPLYRLATLCGQVSRRAFSASASLREQDQLQELAEEFAKMMRALEVHQEKQRAATREVKSALSESRLADGRMSEAAAKRIEQAVEELEALARPEVSS